MLGYDYRTARWTAAIAMTGGDKVHFKQHDLGSWFDGWAWGASPTASAARGTQFVGVAAANEALVNAFANVYNTIELDHYPGLMKGTVAVTATSAGNPLEQATLLVEKLESLGFAADVLTGRVRAPAQDVARWLGVRHPAAARNLLAAGLDAEPIWDATSDLRPQGTLEFDHAWVRVLVPTTTGLRYLHLDPSWKFKDLQEGIPGRAADGIALALEVNDLPYELLQPIAGSDGTVKVNPQLAFELFEDRLAEQLAIERPGKSLADVPHDGPILPRAFDVDGLPWGLAADVEQVGSVEAYDNEQAIFASASDRQRLAHRVRVTARVDNPAGFLQPGRTLWSEIFVVPQISRTPIRVVPRFASPLATHYDLVLGDDVVAASAIALAGGDRLELTVEHYEPGNADPHEGSHYVRPRGQVVSLALNARQYAAADLVDHRAAVIASVLGERDDVAIISEVLTYSSATYWQQFNAIADNVSALNHRASAFPRVGSGIVFADPLLEFHPELQFTVAPIGMGLDFKNWVHVDVAQLPLTNAALHPVVQDAIFHSASGLEHAVLEEIVNTRSVSTVRGLQEAVLAGQRVYGIARDRISDPLTAAGTPRFIYLGYDARGQKWRVNRSDDTITEAWVRNLLSRHAPEVVEEILELLAIDGAWNEVWVPSHKTAIEDWTGSVFLGKSGSGLRKYAIRRDGDTSLDGGYVVGPSPRPITTPAGSTYQAFYAGDPVNPANGNMFRDEVDLVVPNMGVPLTFARHYDTQPHGSARLGVGWVHSFSDRIDVAANGDVTWTTHDGLRYEIPLVGQVYQAPAELRDRGHFSRQLGTGNFQFHGRDGIKYLFDRFGRLRRKLDRNGDGVAIEYTSTTSTRIRRIFDAHTTRRRLEFSYNAENLIESIHLVTTDEAFNSASSNTWTYAYIAIEGQWYLSAVSSPTDAHVSEPLVTRYDYHRSGPLVGLMRRITEPDGSTHDYEYYPNGRAFRVRDAAGHSHSFSYDTYRQITTFVDERGHPHTYHYNAAGLQTRHTFPDRSREAYRWGEADQQYLMLEATDRSGYGETFVYASDGLPYEALVKSIGRDGLETRYTYSQPERQPHILNVASIETGSPESARRTTFDYDNFGRLSRTTDAEGNTESRYYYPATHATRRLQGALWTETSANGTDDGYPASWSLISSRTVAVTQGSLTIRLEYDRDPTATGPQYVIADAVRIDRVDYTVPYSRTLDNTPQTVAEGEPGFRVSGGVNPPSTGHSRAFAGDWTTLNAVGEWAEWTFSDLPDGDYQIAMMWPSATTNSSRGRVVVRDGIEQRMVTRVNQQRPPADFHSHSGDPDESAYTTAYVWDDAGNPARVTTGLPAVTTRAFHPTGGTQLTVDPTGLRTTATYDVLGRLLGEGLADPDGATGPLAELVSAYRYDPGGHLIAHTDPRGFITTHTYDSRGNRTVTTYPDGSAERFTYDAAGNRVAATDETGATTRYVFDSSNRLIQTLHPTGDVDRTRYDGSGRVVAVTDGRGNTTHFEYDPEGRILTTVDPLGHATRHAYNPFGDRISTTDPLGNTTHFVHDNLGREILVEGPREPGTSISSLLTTTDYDPQGNVLRVAQYDTPALADLGVPIPADPRAWIASHADQVRVWNYGYDAHDRATTAVDPLGGVTTTTYDGADRVIAVRDAAEHLTTYGYDAYGRRNEIREPAPGPGQPPRIVRHRFDANGNLTSLTDPLGAVTTHHYDVRDRLAATVDPLGGVATFSYDAAGRLAVSVDPRGAATLTRRDPRGREIAVEQADPDRDGPAVAPRTTFAYDSAGNVVRIVDAVGREVRRSYDAVQRVVEESLPTAVQTATYIDDRDPRFERPTGWSPNDLAHDRAFRGTFTAGNGDEVDPVSWNVADLEPGWYLVAATWPAAMTNRQSVPFAIYDGDDHVRTVVVDQQQPPDDLVDRGSDWERLGIPFYLDSGRLRVEMQPGTGSGTFSLADAIRVESLQAAVIDNSDSERFSADPGWSTNPANPPSFSGNYAVANAAGDGTATWSVDVGPGRYQVSATWAAYPDRTANVVYRLFDRDAPVATVSGIDQRQVPDDLRADGTTWEHLGGPIQLTGGQLTIELAFGSGGHFTIADAVRIERVEAVSRTVYDAVGNTIVEIDPLGRRTTHTYDALNRRIESVAPPASSGLGEGTRTAIAYNAFDEMIAITDAGGNTTRFAYDALGRLTRRILPTTTAAAEERFQYDAVGNVVATTDTLGHTTRHEYDALNRRVRTIAPDPDGPGGNAASSVTQFAYDLGDNLIREVAPPTADGTPRVTTYAYDALSRVVRATPPAVGTPRRQVEIIDNGDPGFLTEGDWESIYLIQDAYGNDMAVAGETAVSSAVWTFSDLPPGSYRVSTTWSTGSDRTTDSPYLLFDGDRRLAVVDVDQTQSPGEAQTPQTAWQILAHGVYVASGTLQVRLAPGSGGSFTIADAVRIEALDPSLTYAYDEAGNQTAAWDQLGRVTTTSYDLLGRPSEIMDPDPDGSGPLTSPIVETRYDAAGRIVETIEHRGGRPRSTTYRYNTFDQVAREIVDAGGVNESASSFRYDPVGNLFETTDPAGTRTRYEFDPLDRPTLIVEAYRTASELRTSLRYDDSGNLVEVRNRTDLRTPVTTYAYDARNQRIAETRGGEGATATTHFIRDAAGRVVAVVDPLGRRTSYQFDALDRLVSVEPPDPDGPAEPQESSWHRYEYDAAGNVRFETNAEGETTEYVYDPLDRPREVIDARGHATQMAYDEVSNLTGVTDPTGNVTRFGYDGLDRRVAETSPLGDTRWTAYDDQGNVQRIVDRNGRTREFAYDQLDRVTEERWLNELGEPIHVLAWEYDSLGRVTRASDGQRHTTTEFDERGRLQVLRNYDPTAFSNESPVYVTWAFTYDESQGSFERVEQLGRFPATTEATTRVTTDIFGQVETISQAGPATHDKRVSWQYDLAGNRVHSERATDTGAVLSTTYAYDDADRLAFIWHDPEAGFLSYAYDAADRIIEVVDELRANRLAYDAAGQVTSATATAESFTYDGSGNRLVAAGSATHIESGNRLSSDGEFSYQYDAAGNRTVRTRVAAQPADDYRTLYFWDHRQRLVKVELQNLEHVTTQRIEYDYDAGDIRVGRRVFAADGSLVDSETYVYDEHGQRALTFDRDGTLRHRYLHGSRVDEVLADEVFNAAGESTEMLWLYADHQQSVQRAVDEQGSLRQQLAYDTFGQVSSVGQVAEPADIVFAYTGREWDPDAGLYNYRARWFDPGTGGFISEDPLGFAAGDANLYRYVGNSPLNGIDPSGLTQQGNPLEHVTTLVDSSTLGNGSAGNRSSSAGLLAGLQELGQAVVTAGRTAGEGVRSLLAGGLESIAAYGAYAQAFEIWQTQDFFDDGINAYGIEGGRRFRDRPHQDRLEAFARELRVESQLAARYPDRYENRARMLEALLGHEQLDAARTALEAMWDSHTVTLWDRLKLWDNQVVASNYQNVRASGGGIAYAAYAAAGTAIADNVGVSALEDARSGRDFGGGPLSTGQRWLSGAIAGVQLVGTSAGLRAGVPRYATTVAYAGQTLSAAGRNTVAAAHQAAARAAQFSVDTAHRIPASLAQRFAGFRLTVDPATLSSGGLKGLRVESVGVTPPHFRTSSAAVRLFEEAQLYRRRLPGNTTAKKFRNIVVADAVIDGQRRHLSSSMSLKYAVFNSVCTPRND